MHKKTQKNQCCLELSQMEDMDKLPVLIIFYGEIPIVL